MVLIFLKGLLIGFSIAIPVGPIGLLCIRRTLEKGRLWGLISGLGAASADAVYGCIAGFGLTLISQFLLAHQIEFRLIGGIFLVYSGCKIMLMQPTALDRSPVSFSHISGLVAAYLSMFFLTLTNPLTIFAYLATFAGLGITITKGNGLTAIVLVAGVFLGSTLWWVILSSSVGVLQTRFNLYGLKWINRVSGSMIVLFGVVALLGIRQ